MNKPLAWLEVENGKVEKGFNISIPDEQAESIATVNDAIQYLEANAK